MTEKQNREELIAKRNLVFARFLESPREIHLAIEVKAFDDQIAESTQRMRVEERKVEQKEKNNARHHGSSIENCNPIGSKLLGRVLNKRT
ncbi:MAG: hypothetical protein WBL63_00805 [Candidatus Acidiferrum sp.]